MEAKKISRNEKEDKPCCHTHTHETSESESTHSYGSNKGLQLKISDPALVVLQPGIEEGVPLFNSLVQMLRHC